jgi:hypothetical protein
MSRGKGGEGGGNGTRVNQFNDTIRATRPNHEWGEGREEEKEN